ncbi:MAG: pilus assembly protein PilM [Candidatus Pacebacteria bacterium]|nr:pilus assembly protein PilM [Candidatus Paceibacterota bacterium]
MSLSTSLLKAFPIPVFLEMPHVGLEVSPFAIRFIEINHGGGDFRVGRYGEKKLSTAVDFNKPLIEQKELVDALIEIRTKYKLTFIEATLPEEKAYLFSAEVLDGSDQEIRDNLEFHLEENVPLSLDEAIFDYHKIRSSQKNGKVLVTVSTLPQAVVNGFIALFEHCGLTPISFLLEPQALSRSTIKYGDVGTYLLVRLGEKTTGLSIVSEEATQFTSTLNIGSDDFTAAIMKQFNVSHEEAEKIKHEKGFIKSPENNDLFLSLINISSAIKDEIGRIYTYWQSYKKNEESQAAKSRLSEETSEVARVTRPSPFSQITSAGERAPIAKVILSGKDAALIGFREYLATSLKAEVEIANVWINLFSFDEYIPPIDQSEALDYGAVIGVASPNFNKLRPL